MKNKRLETQLSDEIQGLLTDRKSLMLATIDKTGEPYASYAPYAVWEQSVVVLISEIAVHALNLQHHAAAGVLIIEDEDTAEELFARKRLSYQMSAELIAVDTADWVQGIAQLVTRHGERITSLSQLADFKLFRLTPKGGRYVKGFGRAYALEAGSLDGSELSHLTDGHQQR